MVAAPLTIAPHQRARAERECRLLSPVSVVGPCSEAAPCPCAGHVPATTLHAERREVAPSQLSSWADRHPQALRAQAPRGAFLPSAPACGTSRADSAGGSSRPVGPTPPPENAWAVGSRGDASAVGHRLAAKVGTAGQHPPPCAPSAWRGAGRGPPAHLRGRPAARAAGSGCGGRRATRRRRLDSWAARRNVVDSVLGRPTKCGGLGRMIGWAEIPSMASH